MIDVNQAEKYCGKLNALGRHKEANFLWDLAQEFKRVSNELDKLQRNNEREKSTYKKYTI